MEDYLVYIIPLIIALVTGGIGWRAVHLRAKTFYLTVLGLSVALSVGLYAAAVNASGWDGLGYLIVLFVASLPATAAWLIGGGVGLFTRSRSALPS